MKQSRALNGNLEENRTYVNYVGKNTDSILMHVDNSKNTISADVRWIDMIGTTSGKAYPGELGNQLYNEIITLSKRLSAEVERAIKVENSISIDALNSITMVKVINEELNEKIPALRKEIDSELIILNKQLILECSRATKAEAELLNKFNSIVENNTDAELAESIDKVEKLLINSNSEFTKLIEAEINRAISEEKELKAQIIEELKRAVLSENELQDLIIHIKYLLEDKISEVKVLLSDEIDSRKLADTELDDKINVETNRATTRENELLQLLKELRDVTNESISSLQNKDTQLLAQLNDIAAELLTTNQSIRQEINRATHAELELQRNIDSTNDTILEKVAIINNTITDTNVRIDESNNNIATNTLLITKEANRAKAAEQAITNNIEEVSNIVNVNSNNIKELGNTVNELSTEVDKKFDELETTDTQINNQLSQFTTETNTRLNELSNIDVATQQTIDTISTNVESLNNSTIQIKNRLDNHGDKIEEVQLEFDQRLDDIESELSDTFVEKIIVDSDDNHIKVYAATNKGEAILNTSTTTYEANTLVMRDDNGNIHVPTASSYEDDCLVPSYYVDQIMKDVLSTVENKVNEIKQIKFIDGGNAPI